jgi:outer membrane lipoprotein-sorting protein
MAEREKMKIQNSKFKIQNCFPRSTLRWFCIFNLAFLICDAAVNSYAAETNVLLSAWLNNQTNVKTWSADLVETRTFKSLTQPLTANGHVSFAAPNRFHWELGNPAQTIAIRSTNEMLIIYPRLKRMERYPIAGVKTGPWRDALALLEAGFPQSQAELNSRFKVLSQTLTNDVCEVALEPKSASGRKLMPQIKISFGTNDFSLRATELQFADGSIMRNDFSNPALNPKLEEELFAPKIPGDFKIVEPLKQK